MKNRRIFGLIFAATFLIPSLNFSAEINKEIDQKKALEEFEAAIDIADEECKSKIKQIEKEYNSGLKNLVIAQLEVCDLYNKKNAAVREAVKKYRSKLSGKIKSSL